MDFYRLIFRLRQHRRATYVAIFGVFFVILLAALSAAGFVAFKNSLDQRLAAETRDFDRVAGEVAGTVDALHAVPTALPCSDSYMAWLHRIAFLPDGIHEIIYAPGGQMHCSVNAGIIDPPIQLEAPDFALFEDGEGNAWLDRDLSILGFPGIVGTFVKIGDFILVVPLVSLSSAVPDSINFEVVYRGADGRVWHRTGTHDLYSIVSGTVDANPWSIPVTTGLTSYGCDSLNMTCVAFSAPLLPLARQYTPVIIGGVLLAALMALGLTLIVCRTLRKTWSLSTRFRHRMSAETVVCHYQPLLDLRRDRISGVEVLARWRDDDGTLAYPDTFLPIVEQRSLHSTFTRFVVNRAYEELSAFPPGPEPLRVHFNIFPGEFEAEWMLELFQDFLADKSRFTVVIELVESDALPIERTRHVIAELLEYGILTFIDDFGEGYSSIGYLAGLGTYGVKLDRSFALAPEGSLMDAMLTSAVEMIAKTGQQIIVEGVETASRLTSLKAIPEVAMAQGYFISRPIDIAALGTMLTISRFWPEAKAA